MKELYDSLNEFEKGHVSIFISESQQYANLIGVSRYHAMVLLNRSLSTYTFQEELRLIKAQKSFRRYEFFKRKFGISLPLKKFKPGFGG